MESSQLCIDIISYCAVFFLWLPSLIFLVLCLINIAYCSFMSEHLRRDYLLTVTDEERKIINDYLEMTDYVRVKRHLRKVKQASKDNFKDNDK